MSEALKPEDESPRSPHHVLDELKSVLSSLGQHSEPVAPFEPTPSEPTEEISSSSIFSSRPMSSAPLAPSTPAIPPASPKAESDSAESDADFWSGNVLGWPSEMQEKSSTEPLSKPMPPPMPAIVPTVATPIEPPAVAPQPIMAPPPPPVQPPFVPTQTPTIMPPPPPVVPAPPLGTSSSFPPLSPMADKAPWPLDNELPEPPSAPPSPPKLNVDSSFPSIVESNDAVLGMPDDAYASPVSDAPVAPLPRTVEHMEQPTMSASLEVVDNPLLHPEAVTKPKDLVQIACFFPEGSDKIGQQFAKQLKEAGARQIPSLVIEPVLVSSWSNTNIDLSGWIKSARLSGADVLFILAQRQEIPLFNFSPLSGLQPEIVARLVALEHVPLRTLYADIMIELKRNK